MPKPAYLFKRKGSQNWWLRLQYPPDYWETYGKKREKSLGTPDRALAEIRANDAIDDHKILMFMRKVMQKVDRGTALSLIYPVGHVDLPDGGRAFADEKRVHFFSRDGSYLRSESNLVERRTVSMKASYFEANFRDELNSKLPEWTMEPKFFEEDVALAASSSRKLSADNAYLEDWISHQGISPHIAREARNTFEIFKSLTKDKSFKNANFEDGVLLANNLFSRGNKYATVKKKIGHLCAMINFAVKRNKFRSANPFSNVLRKKRAGDITRRLEFDDADMQRVRETGRSVFSESEWLLWVLLATTGMRLGEALSITHEKTEAGIRYVEIEKGKTEQSQRAIPLPEGVLPLLPKKISGPLFPGEHAAKASKRMNRRLEQIGIDPPPLKWSAL